jgi:endothelin-converting enzyme
MKQLQRAALLAYISIAAAEAPCTTAKCKAVADYILKSLAPNYTALDPCVDFEQYACNGWINTHEIPPSMDTTTPPYVLADENDKIMQAVLSGPYVKNTTLSGINPYDGKNFETIQKVYTTCMNDSSIRAYGVTPLRKMLDEFEAVYPAGPANSSQGLTDALAWLFKRDISSMIALTNVVRQSDFWPV